MFAGTEWLIDAYGCSADRLADLGAIGQTCDLVVESLALKVVGRPVWHKFPHPGGVTGLYLLTESHLACHTFPELGLATFNLYCCNPRERFDWENALQGLLGATQVRVRSLPRGGAPAEPPPLPNRQPFHDLSDQMEAASTARRDLPQPVAKGACP